MTIDKSGEWWRGDAPSDLEEYLKEWKAEGYEVNRFALAVCACGSQTFRLIVDDDEGAAKHACTTCSTVANIGDSEEYYSQDTRAYACVDCRGDVCNVGIGYSLYEAGSDDVRWLSVGVRCPKCGILGCFIDWKIGGGNGPEFFEKT